jgi:branched-chain amino acid transport system ATP-binding protein
MLELRDIDAGYGDTLACRQVSIAVPAGAVVALLGANGAGKTTTLRVASGLVRPRSGHVLIDGTDVTTSKPHARAGLGVCHVPEGRGVFPSLTVRENLLLQVRGDGADAVERAAEAFPVLGRKLAQAAGTMSGGEQQMLALGRALVSQPKVLMMDEISMGLAPIVVEQLFETVRSLKEDGTTILLVEQYLTHALRLADICYVLAKGEVIFAGEPAELRDPETVSRYLGV